MRSKQYIENLVMNLMGQRLLMEICENGNQITSPKDLSVSIEAFIVPKLSKMSAEKLGTIIEYSDLVFLRAHSDRVHKAIAFDVSDAPTMAFVKEGLNTGGKTALLYLANLTVTAIAFDLIKQLDYEDKDDRYPES